MYKVVFYITSNESFVGFKWFKTLEEATSFALLKGSDVMEIKYYSEEDINEC